MAAYYHAPRRYAPSTEPSSHVQQHPLHRRSSLHLADSPTYIFPNPSSAPPSPTQTPILSESSDVSPSVVSISDFGSRDSDTFSSPGHSPWIDAALRQSHNSPQPPLNYRIDNQGLSRYLIDSLPPDPVPLDEDVKVLGNIHRGASNRQASYIPISSIDPQTIETKFRHPLARIPTDPALLPRHDQVQLSRVPMCHPLPRLSIPFLSLFSSLLGIDDSTKDLLTLPTSSASALFPTGMHPPTGTWEETEVPQAAHGAEKLFSVITAENGYQSVHQGMLSLNALPVGELIPIPLSDLWGMVAELVSNGRKVLLGLTSLAHEMSDVA